MTITKNSNRYTALALVTAIVVVLLGLSMAIISGCTDTLKNEIQTNRAPVVYFVNIPPDDTRFSHNPEVYWFGSDVDGQITYYRYLVTPVADVGTDEYSGARDWASNQGDQAWTYVDVDPTLADPQTARVIPLTADPENPVTEYVEQFVFLQAFDDDNLGSVIAVKCLNRNDHPPQTSIYNTLKDDTPYVNAATAGGSITGIALNWEGSDRRDYDEQGLVAPPFEYEWRIYGPYDSAEITAIRDIDSGCWTEVTEDGDSLIITEYCDSSAGPGYVWFTWYSEIGDSCGQYFVGDSLLIDDSAWVADGDTGYWEETDTTIYFNPNTGSDYGRGYWRDTIINVEDELFAGRVVDSSYDGWDTWVPSMRDTIYNVYPGRTGGTTITQHFVFVVRSRDDAYVPDPTPAFCSFPVIDPRHEKDVLVLDFTNTGPPDYTKIVDSSDGRVRRGYFLNLLKGWDPNSTFDTTNFHGDILFIHKAAQAPYLTLSKVLQYKVMIWYSDHLNNSDLNLGAAAADRGHDFLLKAMEAGVNVWANGRALLFGSQSYSGYYHPIQPPVAADYLGVENTFHSAWSAFVRGTHPLLEEGQRLRIEDFIGAYSVDESQWPSLDIDPNLLRDRYTWLTVSSPATPACPFDPDIAALPEVNWCGRRYGTEVMYLYKSLYGRNHPLGDPYRLEGTPIGHRMEDEDGLYRSVFFMFPPWAIDSVQMQELTNNVLDWLYEPWLDR